MKNVHDAVRILNEMLQLDHRATDSLVSHRIECNEPLADHPTVQVTEDCKVGLLGVINGIFSDEGEYVAARLDDETGKLLDFVVLPEHKTARY